MTDLAVTSALILVEEALSFFNHEINLKKHVIEETESIKLWLERIEAYIKDNGDSEGGEMIKTQVKQVRDISYEIQDVLEEFMLHLPHECHSFKLHQKVYEVAHSVKHHYSIKDIYKKIKFINNQMKQIVSLDSLVPSSPPESSRSGNLRVPHILNDDEIIGFEEPIKYLTNQLINGASKVNTIALQGPGGSGKSILVKKVFESKRVRGQFDCHAWVHVSRSYRHENTLEDILIHMLNQFCTSRNEPIPPEHLGADTLSKLNYYLNQKKYLLVLDDVWKTEHAVSLKNALPGNSLGSRIIITTRQSDLVSSGFVCLDNIHHLTKLPWPEAWELFCNKAFQNEDGICPPELKIYSEKILKKCEGSPLAIVAVGGLLSNNRKFPNEWEKFYKRLGSAVIEDSNLAIINKTLLPSYKDLSSNLKNCFLYFSFFPADYSIKRGRLIRLWAAEHFVRISKFKTSEEVAESYLDELISRNLIHASEIDFDGNVTRCRAVNLVLEFVIQKSEEENFVVVDVGPKEKIRRLSIHNPRIIQTRYPNLWSVRSAISFKWDNLSHSEIDDLIGKFKMLRVLDLENAPLEEFPKSIFYLTLLRYLSLRRTRIKTIPKAIKKLPYLETLDLKHTCVTEIPKEIWKLHNLRHLLVYSDIRAKFNSVHGVNVCEGVGALTNLQKLSLVKSDEKCVLVKELGKLIQLKKLGLESIQRKAGKDLCASIEKMENLIALDLCSTSREASLDLEYFRSPPRHLQRLYLKGRLRNLPSWIVSLNNLLKICLKWSRLDYNPLEILQDLPNLMELEMVDSYTGQMLEFEVGKFKKLKSLHIEQFPWLHTMIFLQGSMPHLQKLTLTSCANLKTLPLGIEFLSHVEEFILYDMPKEFTAQLEKSSEDREMINHIPVIHSFTLIGDKDWELQNLS